MGAEVLVRCARAGAWGVVSLFLGTLPLRGGETEEHPKPLLGPVATQAYQDKTGKSGRLFQVGGHRTPEQWSDSEAWRREKARKAAEAKTKRDQGAEERLAREAARQVAEKARRNQLRDKEATRRREWERARREDASAKTARDETLRREKAHQERETKQAQKGDGARHKDKAEARQ